MGYVQLNRTLIIPEYDAKEGVLVLPVVLEKACSPNHSYIVTKDMLHKIIGVLEYNRDFFIGDKVLITDGGRGYIAPGIKQPGYGVIVEINKDDTNHYYRIKMDNGEMGNVESDRIDHVVNDS